MAIRIRHVDEICAREELHRERVPEVVDDPARALEWIREYAGTGDAKEALLQIVAMGQVALDVLGQREGPEPAYLAHLTRVIDDAIRDRCARAKR
jgi:hypothetical protein